MQRTHAYSKCPLTCGNVPAGQSVTPGDTHLNDLVIGRFPVRVRASAPLGRLSAEAPDHLRQPYRDVRQTAAGVRCAMTVAVS